MGMIFHGRGVVEWKPSRMKVELELKYNPVLSLMLSYACMSYVLESAGVMTPLHNPVINP